MCNMCTRDVTISESVDAPPPSVLRRLEKMKEKHNLVTDPESEEKQKEVEYQPDLLAVSTQFTKVAYDFFKQGLGGVKDTKAYAIATRTTQPLQVAVAALVLLAWLSQPGSGASLRAWRALYVTALATHLGAQIWMTLVSGLVLYFALPRHEFGRVQAVLFPVYYLFNSIVSLLALVAYSRTQFLTNFEHTSWPQMALLTAVFSIEALVRLRLVRPMLRAKHMKTMMEEVAGGGQEVGRLVLGELAHCPRYLRVLRTFRSYHSSIVMGTMIALGCSVYSTTILVDSMCH